MTALRPFGFPTDRGILPDVLILLSPAKSLDESTDWSTRSHTTPVLLDRATELVGVMADKTPADLTDLMGISPSLAELNVERFGDFTTPFTPDNAKPAILAFSGDVYAGMDAASFDTRDLTRAQKTVRILSGLYGVLRPLDLMQPYRLEMGTRLAHPGGKDLYSFWGDSVTEQLNRAVDESPGAKTLINLASNEYYGVVNEAVLDAPVISPVFLDAKGDADYKIISFFAKKARGAMSGWIIRNRVTTMKALVDFDGMGYEYDAERSSKDRPVFTRRHES